MTEPMRNRELHNNAPGTLVGELRGRPLTPAEIRTLIALADGKTNKQSAEELRLSVQTIKNQRQAIQEKLGIKSIALLTRYAIREGIVKA